MKNVIFRFMIVLGVIVVVSSCSVAGGNGLVEKVERERFDREPGVNFNVSGSQTAIAVGTAGDESFSAVVESFYDGFITAGYRVDQDGKNNLWIAKFTTTGVLVWEKVVAEYYGLTPVNLYRSVSGSYVLYAARHLVKFNDNGVVDTLKYFVYSSRSKVQKILNLQDGYIMYGTITYVAPLGDQNHLLITKVDFNGNVLWENSFGPSGERFDMSYRPELIEAVSDGVILTGAYTGGPFIMKIDTSGEIVWMKNLPLYPVDLAVNTDGTLVVIADSVNYGAYNKDVWVAKIRSTGEIQWQFQIDSGIEDSASSIITTSDSGYIVSINRGTEGSRAIYLVKLNSSGYVSWDKSYSSIGDLVVSKVTQLALGGYGVSGFTTGYGAGNKDGLLFKTDLSGNIVNSKFVITGNIVDDYNTNAPSLTNATLKSVRGRYSIYYDDIEYEYPAISSLVTSLIDLPQGNVITGTNSGETLYGTAGNDTIIGLGGDDDLYGRAGDDIYIFGTNFGVDYIFEEGGFDTIRFTELAYSQVEVYRSGDHLILRHNSSNRIRVSNFYQNNSSKIESVEFADGTVLTSAQLNNL